MHQAHVAFEGTFPVGSVHAHRALVRSLSSVHSKVTLQIMTGLHTFQARGTLEGVFVNFRNILDNRNGRKGHGRMPGISLCWLYIWQAIHRDLSTKQSHVSSLWETHGKHNSRLKRFTKFRGFLNVSRLL